MYHGCTHKVRSDGLLDELLNDGMLSLVQHHRSVANIILYMRCYSEFELKRIVKGQSPYYETLVPLLGAAYSQTDNSVDTPTIRIIARRFQDPQLASTVAESFRNNNNNNEI